MCLSIANVTNDHLLKQAGQSCKTDAISHPWHILAGGTPRAIATET